MKTDRYEVVFSINEKQVSEEYLGEFNVTDLVTKKLYNFPLRGELNTFDSEFVENSEIGDTCVWVESFDKHFKPGTCNDAEELAEYIEDYKEGIQLYDFLNSEDIENVTSEILKHYVTGQSEPLHLSGLDANFIVNKEIGQLLIKAAETKLSKQDILSFSDTLNGSNAKVTEDAKQWFIPLLANSMSFSNHKESRKLYQMFEQLKFTPVNFQLSKLFKFNQRQSYEMER